MAADILLYDSTHVPVGEDQKQHLELCRDIAQKFNIEFNCQNFLVAPEPLIQKSFSRIMSLKDGTKKMSKSDPSDLSRINLNDSKDTIINKIKKAKTDDKTLPPDKKNINERPEAENLLGIYALLTNQSNESAAQECSEMGWGKFKPMLVEATVSALAPIQKRYNELMTDKTELKKVIKQGKAKAEEVSQETLNRLRNELSLISEN